MLLDATFIKRLSWVHSDGNTWFDPGIVLGSYGAQCEELRLEARAHIYSPPVFPRAGEWDGGARLTRRAAAHELI